MKKGSRKTQAVCLLLSITLLLTLAAGMVTGTLADPGETAPLGSISGRLWTDGGGNAETDGDGLYNGGERPLSGYTVYLYTAGDLSNVLAVTHTGASGTYVFDNLEPGSYVLAIYAGSAHGAEYRAPLTITADNQFSVGDADAQAAYTSAISLGAGEDIRDINGGMLPVVISAPAQPEEKAQPNEPAGEAPEAEEAAETGEAAEPGSTVDAVSSGNISGFLWVDGSGTLLTDWDGLFNGSEPYLPSCAVYLYRADDLTAAIASTQTDAHGVYVFKNLEAGSYVVGIASPVVDGVEYLLPTRVTADCAFVIDWASDPLTAFTAAITLAEGQAAEQVNAGLRLPAEPQTRAGNSYTINVTDYSGDLQQTGRGYRFDINTFTLTFSTAAAGNSYTIYRGDVSGGLVRSIVFTTGGSPASVIMTDLVNIKSITFPTDFSADLTFNNVQMTDTADETQGGAVILPTGYRGVLKINGLSVTTFTFPSDYDMPITFNGFVATVALNYPANYNQPITIAGNFRVKGAHFPVNYSGSIIIGGGVFTEMQHICRQTSLPNNASTSYVVVLPNNISTITMNDAHTTGISGKLFVTLGPSDDLTILLAGSSDIVGYIQVLPNAKLTIDSAAGSGSQGGKLAITASFVNPCIGGGGGMLGATDSGQIIINGGTIEATQTCTDLNQCPAAIGGGAGKAGNVTINGGRVVATGNDYGAAIGGGDNGNGNVTINGGTVVATSGDLRNLTLGNANGCGAAIGGGSGGYGDITITGGYVTANSGHGAGIGSGRGNGGSGVTGGSIAITGGVIRGYSLVGANIGMGFNYGYMPTYRINKEADILMYGRGLNDMYPGVQCSGSNLGDGYFVSVLNVEEAIRGSVYVYDATTKALVRVLHIPQDSVVYMSFLFSTGHNYQENFNIYTDFYDYSGINRGIRQYLHHYDHLAPLTGGAASIHTIKNGVIPSIKDLTKPRNYPHNFNDAYTNTLIVCFGASSGSGDPYVAITEMYVDVNGKPIHNNNGMDSNPCILPEGGNYAKTRELIDGYDYKGYKWDNAPATTSDYSAGDPSMTNVRANRTVYLVYALDPGRANVAVGKVVTGRFIDKDRAFSFTVSLKDASGAALTGAISYTGGVIPGMTATAPSSGTLTLQSGNAVFSLRHGQMITLLNLPADAEIQVTEPLDANYNPSFTDSMGAGGAVNYTGFRVIGAAGSADRLFTFFNAQKVDPVPAGIADVLHMDIILPVSAVLLLLAGWFVMKRIRRNLSARV